MEIDRGVRTGRRLTLGLVSGLGLMVLLTGVPVLAADNDGDGLRNGFERRYKGLDPNKRDTDGDGIVDSAEDLDGDKLGNLGEQRFKTNPRKRDTDRDGKNDGKEDRDRNGKSNAREQDKRPIPAGLKPTLGNAFDDRFSGPPNWPCYTNHPNDSTLRVCEFGDTGSDKTVVLFGDSFGAQWAPGLDLAGKDEGWRLVVLLKSACPSASVGVTIQHDIDGSKTCDKWRDSGLTWIKDNPPDVVIIANANGYQLTPKSTPSKRWKNGLTRTLNALPNSSALMVIGAPPRNIVVKKTRRNGKIVRINKLRNPVSCLGGNKKNMSACVSKRVLPKDRRFHKAESAAAKATGAKYRAIYDKICTYDPCPLVQGNVMMWRDSTHVTETMAKQLSPLFAKWVRAALASG